MGFCMMQNRVAETLGREDAKPAKTSSSSETSADTQKETISKDSKPQSKSKSKRTKSTKNRVSALKENVRYQASLVREEVRVGVAHVLPSRPPPPPMSIGAFGGIMVTTTVETTYEDAVPGATDRNTSFAFDNFDEDSGPGPETRFGITTTCTGPPMPVITPSRVQHARGSFRQSTGFPRATEEELRDFSMHENNPINQELEGYEDEGQYEDRYTCGQQEDSELEELQNTISHAHNRHSVNIVSDDQRNSTEARSGLHSVRGRSRGDPSHSTAGPSHDLTIQRFDEAQDVEVDHKRWNDIYGKGLLEPPPLRQLRHKAPLSDNEFLINTDRNSLHPYVSTQSYNPIESNYDTNNFTESIPGITFSGSPLRLALKYIHFIVASRQRPRYSFESERNMESTTVEWRVALSLLNCILAENKESPEIAETIMPVAQLFMELGQFSGDLAAWYETRSSLESMRRAENEINLSTLFKYNHGAELAAKCVELTESIEERRDEELLRALEAVADLEKAMVSRHAKVWQAKPAEKTASKFFTNQEAQFTSASSRRRSNTDARFRVLHTYRPSDFQARGSHPVEMNEESSSRSESPITLSDVEPTEVHREELENDLTYPPASPVSLSEFPSPPKTFTEHPRHNPFLR